MTAILLNFSQRPDLQPLAEIIADVQSAATRASAEVMIIGALARDLHLAYGHGIATGRATEDVDLALAISDWTAFGNIKDDLIRTGSFTTSGVAHRLRHRSGSPVDLVPFGTLERGDRQIVWPPDGEIVMNVFGFREAALYADGVVLPGGARYKIVSLAGLALLKLVAWQDRHYAFPRKDALDLYLIIRHYLTAGNEERLWTEFNSWTQEEGFDYETASARMLGRDVRQLLEPSDAITVGDLLAEQAGADTPGRLPSEIDRANPDKPRGLLVAMMRGFFDKSPT